MNATEQREHRTVTKALDLRLDSIEPIVLQLMHNDSVIAKRFDQLDGYTRSLGEALLKDFGRLSSHDAQLASLEAIERRCAALTFWQRLRWLLTGNPYSV